MKIKKAIVIVGLLISFTSMFFAQEKQDEKNSIITCQQILNYISKKQNSTGAFEQIRLVKTESMERKFVTTGDFLFCPKGIVLWSQKPFKNTTVLTPSYVKNILPNGKQNVTGDNPGFENIARIFIGIFSGDLNTIEENFVQEFGVQGNRWHLSLEPTNSAIKNAILNINLFGTFSETDAELTGYTLIQNGNVQTTFNFSKIAYPQTLSEEQNALF